MTLATETAMNDRVMTVGELAARVQGDVVGDVGALIRGASSIEDAEDGDVVYAENAKFLSRAAQSRASAIVAFIDAVQPDKPLIKVNNPQLAFARILELFAPPLNAPAGAHPTAVLGEDVVVPQTASVGANAILGDGVRLGERTIVMSGVFVGDGCIIGDDCILYPNVTLYAGCLLGDRVILHSGAVIGGDGFGYTTIGEKRYKIPHIGIVEIGDDVEIGANSTVDRAKTGATVIGARTKIDNLVHIAHNVKVGTDCIVVAQTGVAGSCQLGRGVMLAGQAGLKDHVTIGEGSVVMAQGGVFGDIPPGQMYSGYPARPHREKLRQEAAVEKLPEYLKRIRALEKANAQAEARTAALEGLVQDLVARLDAGREARK